MNKTRPQLRRQAAEDSFALFFVYYMAHYVKAPFAEFHYEMSEDLHDLTEGTIKELAWFQFRESGKTSFAKGFILWSILYKKFDYINVDSHDKANAERFLFDVVLELQTNQSIRYDFGEIFNAKRKDEEKTQKRISDFLTTNGVRVEAHSTQEPVRGRLHGSTRPQLVVLDDFEDLTTIRSEAATRQVREHIAEFKGGLDQDRGRILYLGNYLSESGNVQAIMDKGKEDPKTRVRSVWLLKEDNYPSWPEKYALDDFTASQEGKISIESLKKSMWTPQGGNSDFMREMMGKPFDMTLAKFRREMFRPITREEVDKMETAAYLLIDPPGRAYTLDGIRRGEGDFIGWALVKVTTTGKWMVEAWRRRQSPREMIDTMFSLWDMELVVQIGVEDTAFWQGIKTLVEEEEVKRGTRLNIQEIKHTAKASKGDRILALLPRYENHSIWHVQDKCNDLELELLRFPISDHDDCSDAFSMACEIVDRPRREGQSIQANKASVNAYCYGSSRMSNVKNMI